MVYHLPSLAADIEQHLVPDKSLACRNILCRMEHGRDGAVVRRSQCRDRRDVDFGNHQHMYRRFGVDVS